MPIKKIIKEVSKEQYEKMNEHYSLIFNFYEQDGKYYVIGTTKQFKIYG